MKKFFLNALLSLLRSFIYIKRALLFVFRILGRGVWPFFRFFGKKIIFPMYYIAARMGRQRSKSKVYSGMQSRRNAGVIPSVIAVVICLCLFAGESTLYAGEPLRGDAPINDLIATNKYGEADIGATVSEEDAAPVVIDDTDLPFGGTVAGGRSIIAPVGGTVTLPETPASQGTRHRVITYVVENGDTFGAIAKKFNISVDTLLTENQLSAKSKIHEGDALRVLPVDGISYRVARGDTLSGIAKKYNADVQEIKTVNKIVDDTSLIAGEVIVLPGAKAIASAPPPVAKKPKATVIVEAPPVEVSHGTDVPSGTSSGTLLRWPTSGHVITQYFSSKHSGVDIDGDYDSPIYAAEDGIVVKAGWNTGGYGLYIVIDHGGGMQTVYGHTSKEFVNVGDRVTRGQIIAMVGTTGHSTGTHLHFEVRKGNQRLNPLRFIR